MGKRGAAVRQVGAAARQLLLTTAARVGWEHSGRAFDLLIERKSPSPGRERSPYRRPFVRLSQDIEWRRDPFAAETRDVTLSTRQTTRHKPATTVARHLAASVPS